MIAEPVDQVVICDGERCIDHAANLHPPVLGREIGKRTVIAAVEGVDAVISLPANTEAGGSALNGNRPRTVMSRRFPHII